MTTQMVDMLLEGRSYVSRYQPFASSLYYIDSDSQDVKNLKKNKINFPLDWGLDQQMKISTLIGDFY